MQHPLSPLSADRWIFDLFSAKAARSGGVVRASLRDIQRYVGRIEFESELRRRGFHAVENAGQIVIFCNQGPIRQIL